jgi:hypothetical protein
VLHQHSATGREGSSWKHYQLGRNKVWLVAKNYPAARWRWLPLVVAYDIAAMGYALTTRREVAALRGRLAGLAGLPGALRARAAAAPRAAHVDGATDGPRPAADGAADCLLPPVWPWQVPARYTHLRPLAARSRSARIGTGARCAP